FLTEPENNLYGTAFAAYPDGHNTLYDFVLQTWSRDGDLTDLEGRPQLVSPASIQALDFYRAIVRNPALCHPRSANLDSTQSGDLFLNGEVAMMTNWFGFAARACRPGSPLEGKVAIAQVPCEDGADSVSLSVFWALAMGSGSLQKPLAWDFLRFVTSPERDLGITHHGAVGARLSTWRDPGLRAEVPVYAQVENISLRARTLPAGPSMAAFASIVDGIMTRALRTTDPTVTILEEAQQEVDRAQLRLL
ncbi:MAG: extracellular solute-binding protein, partial [Terracidiphilus sp.]